MALYRRRAAAFDSPGALPLQYTAVLIKRSNHSSYTQKHLFSAEELQQAIQAVTIYLIMAIVDQDDETPARGSTLMQTAAVVSPSDCSCSILFG